MLDTIPDSIKYQIPSKTDYRYDKVNLNDPRVWNAYQRGDCVGVFQVETPLGIQWCKKIKPSNIEDLSAVISLVRPGPLRSGESDLYASRKGGKTEISYLHPALEPILNATYGVICYQEQCMKIAMEIGGFSESAAMVLVKAVSKKLPALISQIKTEFIDKATAKGIVSKEMAEEIFAIMQRFQRYGFNKCLSPTTTVMSDRIKTIAELEEGEFIKAPKDYHNNKDKYVKVIKKYDNGPKDLFQIIFENGTSIECTMTHKFLSQDKVIRPLWQLIHLGYGIMTDDYGFQYIEDISYLGLKETCDIEVDSDEHLFYGNGLATSNSHGIEYSIDSYLSMAAKVYFPVEFYCSWLTFSSEKIDPKEEVYKLVQDAKAHNISILPPDIRQKNTDFKINRQSQRPEILFGLSHIKGIGDKAAESITKSNNDFNNFNDFIKSVKKIKRNVAESLVKSGACDCYGISRTYMLKNLHALFGRSTHNTDIPSITPLTVKEYKCLDANINELGIEGLLRKIIETNSCVKKRIPILEEKIAYLSTKPDDTNRQRSIWESLYLGVSLTCSAADDFDKIEKNINLCKDIIRLKNRQNVVLHVVIDKILHKKTSEKAKNPNLEYCYLGVSDNTGSFDSVVCWPEIYETLKEKIFEGAVVCIYGMKDSWNYRDQITVKRLEIIG